jgi:hypothetical protein
MQELEEYAYGLFPVYGNLNIKDGQPKITVDSIRAYLIETLNTQGAYIKIMSTPDSFYKIMKAAEGIENFDIRKDCFLLLDEGHSFITEAFRENILVPFDYFWEFSKKSVISATPYCFSDPRFAEMDYHRVKFSEPYIADINIVSVYSVKACLHNILTNPDFFPGNVFIFLNSVTDNIEAIKRAELKEANMFYADDDKNHEKLAGFEYFYQDEPLPGVYKKFNFFTCKYFEGWDLRDPNATLILLTDIHSPNTRIRPSNKGVQAVGRFRTTPECNLHKIYHITNHRNTNEMLTQDIYENDFKIQAEAIIDIYNMFNTLNKEILPEIKYPTKKYANICNGVAQLDHNKLDQVVNQCLTNEEYANRDFIGKQWKEALYNPCYSEFSERLPKSKTQLKRASKAVKLREDVEEIDRLEKQKETTPFNLAYNELNELKAKSPLAYQAHKELGIAKLIEMEYKETKIKSALITQSNSTAEMKLRGLLMLEFQLNMRYTKEDIKFKLQRLYNKVGLKNNMGDIKIATAEQLGDSGRFKIRACKVKVGNSYKSGFVIDALDFQMTATA